jgi:hypothetical protein
VLAAAIGVAVALLTRQRPANTAHTGGGTTAASSDLPDSVKAIDNPLAGLPGGWSQQTVQPSQYGTAGGFRIGAPPGWIARQRSLATYLDAPDGVRYMDVDLTMHDRANMVGEAEYVERNAVAKGNLPGYHRLSLRPVSIRGTAGAFWAFTWVTPSGVTMRAEDLLFELQTPAGPQSYAAYLTSPSAVFGKLDGLPLFDRILRTFQPLES